MAPELTRIPQESTVSLIIFLMYLIPLFDAIERQYPKTKSQNYVDDKGLVVEGKAEAANCSKLEALALTAFEWGNEHAVLFDDPISELMQNNNKILLDQAKKVNVTLPNGTIRKTTQIQHWLGVWLDKKLDFKENIRI